MDQVAGLYLHVPFCTQRCIYCDFYFVTTASDHEPYLRALSQEMKLRADSYSEPLETIYLGGGTPSALSIDEVSRILEDAHEAFETSDAGEVTFEINPEDASPSYLQGLREAGVNRLSIGIQSFFEEDLEFMGRSHSVKEAQQVIPMAREAGFEQFSVDLIFGLPHQPASSWKRNLAYASEADVPHLSTYGLTIEPKTPLAKQVERGLVSPAPDEEMAERYQITMDFLRAEGYEHYEISSFAKPGARASHNQLYWTHSNYLGLGPSAHSFWWNDEGVQRWANPANLRTYTESLTAGHLPDSEWDTLHESELAAEYLMLRLRTVDGVDLGLLLDRYGYNLKRERESDLDELETQGYVDIVKDDCLRLTDRGKHVCDSVTERLLP